MLLFSLLYSNFISGRLAVARLRAEAWRGSQGEERPARGRASGGLKPPSSGGLFISTLGDCLLLWRLFLEALNQYTEIFGMTLSLIAAYVRYSAARWMMFFYCLRGGSVHSHGVPQAINVSKTNKTQQKFFRVHKRLLALCAKGRDLALVQRSLFCSIVYYYFNWVCGIIFVVHVAVVGLFSPSPRLAFVNTKSKATGLNRRWLLSFLRCLFRSRSVALITVRQVK